MVRIWVAKVMILLGSLEWIRNIHPLFTSSSYYSVLFSVQYIVCTSCASQKMDDIGGVRYSCWETHNVAQWHIGQFRPAHKFDGLDRLESATNSLPFRAVVLSSNCCVNWISCKLQIPIRIKDWLLPEDFPVQCVRDVCLFVCREHMCSLHDPCMVALIQCPGLTRNKIATKWNI